MKLINWVLFTALSVIWGSSFVLMKEGMAVLSPYQVATLRILSAGIVLLPFTYKSWKLIPKQKLGTIILSGLIGSFFPAYLFCIAETKIDSSLAGILNALTPLFTIITGILFFDMQANAKKIAGVVIGFIGLILLFTSNGNIDFKNIAYSLLVLIATLMYGVNVNMVGKYMKEVGAINIATIAFVLLIVPCCIILYCTGYFNLPMANKAFLISTAASVLLGIMGTAVATVLFYRLLKNAGALFASMVTYGIPVVAVIWGLFYHETITPQTIISLLIILFGVYIVNAANKNPLSILKKRDAV